MAPTAAGSAVEVVHEGYKSLDIRPAAFYSSGTYSEILSNEFQPNTVYLFDMWIDSDEVVYNGNNVPGGMIVRYSDGTTYTMAPTGSASSPKSFQHLTYRSTEGKSVSSIRIYYYTSMPVYYRFDSLVIPASDPMFYRTGVIESGYFTETLSGVNSQPGFQKGNIFTEQFYEI